MKDRAAVTILVVDDNDANRKLASFTLRYEGFEVLEARNAHEALSSIAQTEIDLILMDIALEGIDGLTLTRILKSDQATERIKVVALTAYAMPGDEQRAKSAGCDGYITKPINTRLFASQLAEHIECSS